MAERSGALRHIRVLDLTRVRAGPNCCRVLADFGADVIKIEAPEGVDANAGANGPRDGSDMQNLHRSKRSLTLNLKKPAALGVFRKLVETADVVVENFRPDVKERLGIGYEALAAINPRIILASISGFGQTGPYEKRAGYDQIAQGMGGLMAVTGLPGQGPVRAGTAPADLYAGLYACTGVLVALAEREVSGRGQWVQSSLLEAQIALMDFQAARYLVEGEVPEQAGNDHPTSTPMGVIATADGHLNLGVAGDGQWQALCRALKRPDLAADPRFLGVQDRLDHREACWAEIRPEFAKATSAEWMERLGAESVPCGPIYRMNEVFADPQVRHVGIAQEVEHPRRGPIRLVGQPVTLSRTPASLWGPGPDAGQHNAELLSELGLSEAQIAALRNEGAV